jgi:DNA-binding transcriptional LysR family regulator
VHDLENEIGVDVLHRSTRGVTLTAEGRVFLEEVRELLKRAHESVEKVRALGRGEYSELRVGYTPTLAVEILPPGIAAFRKSMPRAKVRLYDLLNDELIIGLRNGTLDLAIMAQLNGAHTAGIEFELLRAYPVCVALPATHPFTHLKSVPLEKVAAESLIGLRREDYPEYYRGLESIFAPIGVKPDDPRPPPAQTLFKTADRPCSGNVANVDIRIFQQAAPALWRIELLERWTELTNI